MNVAALNGAITLAKSAFFDGAEIEIIKEYEDGLVAGLNASKTAVAIFADAGEGELFSVSGWVKPAAGSDFIELADSIYS